MKKYHFNCVCFSVAPVNVNQDLSITGYLMTTAFSCLIIPDNILDEVIWYENGWLADLSGGDEVELLRLC